ncbi:hydrogenobyrinate a,c-diamide synthase [Amylibacter ulvae]|uniref:Hydrogenobyrinate a,c-diamide synthase n=1 Tax=Paramylibacter ulvae TaxID=1651968 RepID=A0ABQ3CU48_9RHOB|nr:cobyrinate a,c-diamide synthase [Amylibacter ulvae]GHA43349.1 hydrogenobyrinate a,c-diamide synthase [Amylibacter ulvae]
MNGVIIAAPSSGSGKTTITLGLLRALRNAGIAIRSAKSGPDYIDPRFHAAASGNECVNLDAWAMTPERIQTMALGDTPMVIEGAMGLFDGAPPAGKGATADLARILQIPVVLVVDVSHQAQSVAAVVSGFANHRADVRIAGLILNKVGSPRHETMLRDALIDTPIPILGCVHRDTNLQTPSRHLGLVQASERGDLEVFLENAADVMAKHIDLHAFQSLFSPMATTNNAPKILPPPAQSIAIASDAAFAFSYPHLLDAWKSAGASLSFFSPLNNEAPASADLVILPGGYPELHAGKLASNDTFLSGVRNANAVYGECGGYMAMGDGIVDADGVAHKMLGLLRLETSFFKRKLTLGYRSLSSNGGIFDGHLNAHEFHYATTLRAIGDPLFSASDANGVLLADMGLIRGQYSGSFAHVIDRA